MLSSLRRQIKAIITNYLNWDILIGSVQPTTPSKTTSANGTIQTIAPTEQRETTNENGTIPTIEPTELSTPQSSSILTGNTTSRENGTMRTNSPTEPSTPQN